VVFDELDRILLLCEVEEGKGRRLRAFEYKIPQSRLSEIGRTYPKWTWRPASGLAEWESA
jgi:hypothetical protein